MHVYANWITPVQSLRQNAVARGKSAAATPCSSIGESSWRAQFIKRTIRSNCWCSSIALFPKTRCPSSEHKANRATLAFKARTTAGKLFLASEILFSKIHWIQFRKTSRRRAEFPPPPAAIIALFVVVTRCPPDGTIRGCAGLGEDNLKNIKNNYFKIK